MTNYEMMDMENSIMRQVGLKQLLSVNDSRMQGSKNQMI